MREVKNGRFGNKPKILSKIPQRDIKKYILNAEYLKEAVVFLQDDALTEQSYDTVLYF
jgi:hypothetical protein